jgi:hypothetical protein
LRYREWWRRFSCTFLKAEYGDGGVLQKVRGDIEAELKLDFGMARTKRFTGTYR